MRSMFGVPALCLMATACATPRSGWAELTPQQAVMAAADRPAGVSGLIAMTVRASGRQGGLLYLNSEEDYRDPRNLSIVVPPAIEQALEARFGGPVEPYLRQRHITVKGTAHKVRIDFTAGGRPTGKYYFQTHLWLQAERDLALKK